MLTNFILLQLFLQSVTENVLEFEHNEMLSAPIPLTKSQELHFQYTDFYYLKTAREMRIFNSYVHGKFCVEWEYLMQEL